MSARAVEIIGGGLAGLALGVALRRAGVPTTILEAGEYPRHRVCGEFIAGLRSQTIAELGLAEVLEGAQARRDVIWFLRGASVLRQQLPEPALTISRHVLDQRLARVFSELGGQLICNRRADLRDAPPGRVFATGRRKSKSPWVGLKLHACNLPRAAELEFHLGDGAYVGLCDVGGRVNVCGLFRQRSGVPAGEHVLENYLQASGLADLAARLSAADVCAGSRCAVAGIAFAVSAPARGRLEIGDALAMIPPFTGNGMAMAFESAAEAVEPLLAWTRGEQDWPATVQCVGRRLRYRFRTRLASAAAIQPLLVSRRVQPWISRAAARDWLPMRTLYRALH